MYLAARVKNQTHTNVTVIKISFVKIITFLIVFYSVLVLPIQYYYKYSNLSTNTNNINQGTETTSSGRVAGISTVNLDYISTPLTQELNPQIITGALLITLALFIFLYYKSKENYYHQQLKDDSFVIR